MSTHSRLSASPPTRVPVRPSVNAFALPSRQTIAALLSLGAAILLLSACNTTVNSTSARARRTAPVPTTPPSEESLRAEAEAKAKETTAVDVTDAPPEPPKSSGLATGRGILRAELAPMRFIPARAAGSELAVIKGRVELCLTPQLRARQWNVPGHPFRIDLGSAASLNVERLTKSAFAHVKVSLGRDCPTTRGLPAFDVRIRSANRDPYWSVADKQQRTSVTLVATFYDADGRTVWRHAEQGDSNAPRERRMVLSPSGLTSRRHHHAAREFGFALQSALARLHTALLESEEIRDVYTSADPN